MKLEKLRNLFGQLGIDGMLVTSKDECTLYDRVYRFSGFGCYIG